MNPKLPRITSEKVIRALKRAGFVEWRQRRKYYVCVAFVEQLIDENRALFFEELARL